MYDLPDSQNQQEELEKVKKNALRSVLTKEAMERLGRVRLVNPLLTQQIELYLLQLLQTGQVKEKIDDVKFKQILSMLSEKKSFSIKRK